MAPKQVDALYVQYGCGFSPGIGWMNFDSSPTLRVERIPVIGSLLSAGLSGNARRFPDAVHYGDIRKGLPIADDQARGIYASHVLEHLSFEEFQIAIANTYKILAPGGVFRLVVPDLLARATRYVSSAGKDPGASVAFLRETLLGREQRPSGPMQFLREMIGGSAHLWMWDYPSIVAELERAGFAGMRKCAFGDAIDPMFSRVEDQKRFVDPEINVAECAVEARKPPL